MATKSDSDPPVLMDVTAWRIARRCLGIIEPLLRQEEKGEAAREFYDAVREELIAIRPAVKP